MFFSVGTHIILSIGRIYREREEEAFLTAILPRVEKKIILIPRHKSPKDQLIFSKYSKFKRSSIIFNFCDGFFFEPERKKTVKSFPQRKGGKT